MSILQIPYRNNDIDTKDSCSEDSCSYMFSTDTITTSYSVDVEILSCVTERVRAVNTSICKKKIFVMQLISFPNYITVCDRQDLLLPGVEWGDLSLTPEGLGVYSFSGGNVTFDGVSLGSTATYLTNEHYRVNGSQVFTSKCESDNWVLPSTGITTGEGWRA